MDIHPAAYLVCHIEGSRSIIAELSLHTMGYDCEPFATCDGYRTLSRLEN